jgi:hypothetical protein
MRCEEALGQALLPENAARKESQAFLATALFASVVSHPFDRKIERKGHRGG